MAIAEPVTVKVKLEWEGRMSPTELAHWRYRVQALTDQPDEIRSNIRHVQSWARQQQDVPGPIDPESYWGQEVAALNDELDMTRWLLEEAKYMSILGDLL